MIQETNVNKMVPNTKLTLEHNVETNVQSQCQNLSGVRTVMVHHDHAFLLGIPRVI
jgi:hypothetical protein